jgi:hypothetical protein
MKNFISFCLACALISTEIFVNAQTVDADKKRQDQTIEAGTKKKMAKDLLTRFPLSKNSEVAWENSSNGFTATYSYGENTYMTNYDKRGSYRGTLIRRDWETQALPNTKYYFNNSQYKTMKVGSYWEVSDGPKQGSYIMATNEQGAPSYFFIDEQGQISDNPFDN